MSRSSEPGVRVFVSNADAYRIALNAERLISATRPGLRLALAGRVETTMSISRSAP